MKKLLLLSLFLLASCSSKNISVGDCLYFKGEFWSSLISAQKSEQSRMFILSLQQKCRYKIYRVTERVGNKVIFEVNKCIKDATIKDPSEIFEKVQCAP